MARPRRRNPSPSDRNRFPNLWPLYAAETTRGWRVTRNVSYGEAERKVALGVYERVYNQQWECVGYQMVDAGPTAATLSSQETAAGITKSEIEANAGVRGGSRTKGLPEALRLARVDRVTGKRLPPEDFVERAAEKVKDWRAVGDDRASSAGKSRRARIQKAEKEGKEV